MLWPVKTTQFSIPIICDSPKQLLSGCVSSPHTIITEWSVIIFLSPKAPSFITRSFHHVLWNLCIFWKTNSHPNFSLQHSFCWLVPKLETFSYPLRYIVFILAYPGPSKQESADRNLHGIVCCCFYTNHLHLL